jgi:hypothetical protein
MISTDSKNRTDHQREAVDQSFLNFAKAQYSHYQSKGNAHIRLIAFMRNSCSHVWEPSTVPVLEISWRGSKSPGWLSLFPKPSSIRNWARVAFRSPHLYSDPRILSQPKQPVTGLHFEAGAPEGGVLPVHYAVCHPGPTGPEETLDSEALSAFPGDCQCRAPPQIT